MTPEATSGAPAGPMPSGGSAPGSPLPTIDAPCYLCGSAEADAVWSTADRAFGVPGIYTVACCRRCGFLYQRPRVSDEHLADCYPDRYPRHQEPSPRVPFRGSPGRIRAARWALGTWLGYDAFRDTRAGAFTRLRARWFLGKLRWDCIPWRGGGRYLQAKPRYYLWSLGHWLRDRRRDRLARVCEWRPVYGVLKLLLEVTLPVVCWARLGEVIRVGVVPRERAQ